MAAPAINSITFDQSSYNPGDTITATVNYTPGTSTQTETISGSPVTRQLGSQTVSGSLNLTFVYTQNDQPTAFDLSDPGSRVWTQISDDGANAVFQTIA